MKKIHILYLVTSLSLTQFSYSDCFIAQEKNKILYREGICSTRYSPCSTFKIPISLMGYDSDILKDETHPEIPYKKGYARRV